MRLSFSPSSPSSSPPSTTQPATSAPSVPSSPQQQQQHAAAVAFRRDLTRHCLTIPRTLSAYAIQQQQLRQTARTLQSHLSRLLLVPTTPSPLFSLIPNLKSRLTHRLLQEIDVAVSVLSSTIASLVSTVSSLSSIQATIAAAASTIQADLLDADVPDVPQDKGKGSGHLKERKTPAKGRASRGQQVPSEGVSEDEEWEVKVEVSVVELLMALEEAVYAVEGVQARQGQLMDAVTTALTGGSTASPTPPAVVVGSTGRGEGAVVASRRSVCGPAEGVGDDPPALHSVATLISLTTVHTHDKVVR